MMMLRDSLKFLALPMFVGLGCVITTGVDDDDGSGRECGDLLTNSEVVGDECFCEPGYQWEDPSDPNNYECERAPTKGTSCDGPNLVQVGDSCACESGYEWADPDDEDNLSCVPSDDDKPSNEGGGTDDGSEDDAADDSGGDDGPVGPEPDPADCTPENEGSVACNNTDPQVAEGSRLWQCQSGQWVETWTPADETCVADGYEIGVGCVTVEEGTEVRVDFFCFTGSGAACEDSDPEACLEDGIQFTECFNGRTTQDNCETICQEIGMNGVMYDSGTCVQNGDVIDCACCDAGEEGCPAT